MNGAFEREIINVCSSAVSNIYGVNIRCYEAFTIALTDRRSFVRRTTVWAKKHNFSINFLPPRAIVGRNILMKILLIFTFADKKALIQKFANVYFFGQNRVNTYYVAVGCSKTSWQPVWPDLAKFCALSKILKVLRNYWRFWSLFSKILNFLWQNMLYFIAFNWPNIENNIAIWTHCWQHI